MGTCRLPLKDMKLKLNIFKLFKKPREGWSTDACLIDTLVEEHIDNLISEKLNAFFEGFIERSPIFDPLNSPAQKSFILFAFFFFLFVLVCISLFNLWEDSSTLLAFVVLTYDGDCS